MFFFPHTGRGLHDQVSPRHGSAPFHGLRGPGPAVSRAVLPDSGLLYPHLRVHERWLLHSDCARQLIHVPAPARGRGVLALLLRGPRAGGHGDPVSCPPLRSAARLAAARLLTGVVLLARGRAAEHDPGEHHAAGLRRSSPSPSACRQRAELVVQAAGPLRSVGNHQCR